MPLLERSASYREQIANLCQVLRNSPVVRQHAPSVWEGSLRLLNDLRLMRHRDSFPLSISPNWKVELSDREVCGPRGRTELHFGGEIHFVDGALHRQALSVVILFRSDATIDDLAGCPSLEEGVWHVVRRFHFDFDRSTVGDGKPLAHIQLGGQLFREYLDIDSARELRYDQFDQLDYPRLPWTITDMAIIMHAFLRQFPSDIASFIEGPVWSGCVMESERIWLKDFYRDTAEMMESEHRRMSQFDYTCAEQPFDI
jgi:hypothetical protein